MDLNRAPRCIEKRHVNGVVHKAGMDRAAPRKPHRERPHVPTRYLACRRVRRCRRGRCASIRRQENRLTLGAVARNAPPPQAAPAPTQVLGAPDETHTGRAPQWEPGQETAGCAATPPPACEQTSCGRGQAPHESHAPYGIACSSPSHHIGQRPAPTASVLDPLHRYITTPGRHGSTVTARSCSRTAGAPRRTPAIESPLGQGEKRIVHRYV